MADSEDYRLFIITPTRFLKRRHEYLLKKFMYCLPRPYGGLDSCRITVLLFSLSGLSLLNELNNLNKEEMDKIVDWIYRLQLTSKHGKILIYNF